MVMLYYYSSDICSFLKLTGIFKVVMPSVSQENIGQIWDKSTVLNNSNTLWS